jgi:sulfoxide reductase heme-binding subunit YedZ
MNTSQSLTDPTQHIFWLASRSLGIVAMLLVSISVGLGLAFSARLGTKPGSAARLKTLHEAVALTSLLAIGGHGLLLLGDAYLHPTLAQITIPFTLQPVWTGIGVVAGWLALILGLSFYVRRWIGVRLWRWLHRWTVAVFALALVHTIGSGTDATSAWLVVLLALAAVPVVFIGGYRYLAAERPAGKPPLGQANPHPGFD